MKGAYILLIRLDAGRKIRVGALGSLHFKKGYYAYVGSAMGGIGRRLMRHLSKEKKKHWHIDYLLERGKILEVYCFPSPKKEECAYARRYTERFTSVPHFGCADCGCQSHLFYAKRLADLRP